MCLMEAGSRKRSQLDVEREGRQPSYKGRVYNISFLLVQGITRNHGIRIMISWEKSEVQVYIGVKELK